MFSLVDAGALGWWWVVRSLQSCCPRGRMQTCQRQALLLGTSLTGTSETQRPEAGAAAADITPLPTATSGNPSSSPVHPPRSSHPCESRLSPDSEPQSACRLYTRPTHLRRDRGGMNHFSLSRFYFSRFKKSTYSSYYSEDEKKSCLFFWLRRWLNFSIYSCKRDISSHGFYPSSVYAHFK